MEASERERATQLRERVLREVAQAALISLHEEVQEMAVALLITLLLATPPAPAKPLCGSHVALIIQALTEVRTPPLPLCDCIWFLRADN